MKHSIREYQTLVRFNRCTQDCFFGLGALKKATNSSVLVATQLPAASPLLRPQGFGSTGNLRWVPLWPECRRQKHLHIISLLLILICTYYCCAVGGLLDICDAASRAFERRGHLEQPRYHRQRVLVCYLTTYLGGQENTEVCYCCSPRDCCTFCM